MSASSPAVIDGKYELIELAGEGGMASVWRAQVRGAAGFSRTVAIKKIKSEYRAIRNYTDMFIEEARVGSELAHPNIVQVFDFCADPQGSYYIVMEWVDGMDLGSFVKAYRDRGHFVPWPLVAAIGVETLRGLGAAHDRRRPDGTPAPIVHRDVSPHNVLIGANGVVKLTDFGLARARDRVISLTAPGTVKGKLSYLSPEVAMGGQATPASDLFAMGAVLWEALTGVRLFEARSDLEVFKLIRQCVIKPINAYRNDVPDEMVSVLDRVLVRDPASRFASAASFASVLTELLRDSPLAADAETRLAQAVTEVRASMGVRRNPVLDSDHWPTWNWRREPAPAPRGTPPAPVARPVTESVDVEIDISAPDLSVEPIELTRRKGED